MRNILLFSLLLISAGCAKNPDKIAAVEVGKNEYNGYSCKRLNEAEIKYKHVLENASAKQKDAATGDAIGVLLLGLPIASLANSDSETTIAVTKGHLQAIERKKASKSCK
jgi:hypothetical protein